MSLPDEASPDANTMREPQPESLDRLFSQDMKAVTDADLLRLAQALWAQRDKWRADELSGKRTRKGRALSETEATGDLADLLDL